MDKRIIRECLLQLLKVYVYAEQQYLHSAIDSLHLSLNIFYRQRAFERSDFILQIQDELDKLGSSLCMDKTVEAFYEWHYDLYGGASLEDWPVTNIHAMNIDEKGLEICNCLLNDKLPVRTHRIIERHRTRIESSLLSFTYLKALYKNNQQ